MFTARNSIRVILSVTMACLAFSFGLQAVGAQRPAWIAPGLASEYNYNAWLPGAAAAVSALYRWEVLAVVDLPRGPGAQFATSVGAVVNTVNVLFEQGNPEIWMPLRAFAGAIKENLEIEGLGGIIPTFRTVVHSRGLSGVGWFDQVSGIMVKLDIGAEGGNYVRANVRRAAPGLINMEVKQVIPPKPVEEPKKPGPDLGGNTLLIVGLVAVVGGLGAILFYSKRGKLGSPASVSGPAYEYAPTQPPATAGRASVCFGCGATIPAGAASCPKCGKAKGAPGFKGK